jgi:hypothetical protein
MTDADVLRRAKKQQYKWSDSMGYLFLLYLMVSSNYLGSLFGCRVQHLMENNMLIKHVLAFFALYFTISLMDRQSVEQSPIKKVLHALGIYGLFVVSTKMHYKIWSIYILMLAVIYTISILRKQSDLIKPEHHEKVDTVQRWLMYASLAILVVGFFFYYGEKKLEFKKKFKFWDFLIGNPKCQHRTMQTSISKRARAIFD